MLKVNYSTDAFERPRVDIDTPTHDAKIYAYGNMHVVTVRLKSSITREVIAITPCNNIAHGIKIAAQAFQCHDKKRCEWCKDSLALYSPTTIRRDYNGHEYCPACWEELHS